MERLDPVAETRLLDAAGRAGKFFMGRADVLRALEKVSRLLEEDGVDYALVGALALNEHGYERSTAGVDLLLTPHGLAMFKERHVSRGYLEKFPGSRGLLDVENRVPIDVVLAGEFPGDGKPKPVRFPDPAAIARGGAKLRVVPLVTLVELKLASGISAPHRLRDLADVLELVRAAALSQALADELDPYVRAKYLELWHAAQGARDE